MYAMSMSECLAVEETRVHSTDCNRSWQPGILPFYVGKQAEEAQACDALPMRSEVDGVDVAVSSSVSVGWKYL